MPASFTMQRLGLCCSSVFPFVDGGYFIRLRKISDMRHPFVKQPPGGGIPHAAVVGVHDGDVQPDQLPVQKDTGHLFQHQPEQRVAVRCIVDGHQQHAAAPELFGKPDAVLFRLRRGECGQQDIVVLRLVAAVPHAQRDLLQQLRRDVGQDQRDQVVPALLRGGGGFGIDCRASALRAHDHTVLFQVGERLAHGDAADVELHAEEVLRRKQKTFVPAVVADRRYEVVFDDFVQRLRFHVYTSSAITIPCFRTDVNSLLQVFSDVVIISFRRFPAEKYEKLKIIDGKNKK